MTGNTDFTNAQADLAPDPGHGFWSYEVKITPPTLVLKKFGTTPARPSAGKPFTVRLVAARSDTGAVLENGAVKCSASIAGKPLPARTHAIVNKEALCAWLIPKTAKGKTIHGSITVIFEGLKITKSFTAKIG